MPFFSIIIPTKNRSQIVRYAIQSVLRQNFDDFEIILVDNDDTDATVKSTSEYMSDKRLRYFRTGNLSMSENWEFGVQQATGTYLTILEDKQILRRYALSYAHEHLADESHHVATFPYSNMETPQLTQAFFSRLVPGSGFLDVTPQNSIADAPFTLSTQQVIEDYLFSLDRMASLPVLPRGITSFTHHSVVKKIQAGPLGRLCDDVVPDYVMAFQQLAIVDEILVLPKRLSVTGNFTSNGFQVMQKQGNAREKFFQELKEGHDAPFKHVPIKAVLIWNMVVNDFVRIKSIVEGNLTKYDVPTVHYFLNCYWDIAISISIGVDMSQELAEWEAALAKEDDETQHIVKKQIRPIFRRMKFINFFSFNNTIDVIRLQIILKTLFRSSPIFSDPIKLLEWEENRGYSQ